MAPSGHSGQIQFPLRVRSGSCSSHSITLKDVSRRISNSSPLLILFTESLDVGFAVRIKEVLAALLPRRPEFGRCNVPVWPAFLGNDTKILAEFFHRGPAEEPVAIVDFINDKAGLEDNHMRDHRIMGRIRVFGDVEVLLDDTPRVREEGPVSDDTAAI